jgi:hypothetical protein
MLKSNQPHGYVLKRKRESRKLWALRLGGRTQVQSMLDDINPRRLTRDIVWYVTKEDTAEEDAEYMKNGIESRVRQLIFEREEVG